MRDKLSGVAGVRVHRPLRALDLDSHIRLSGSRAQGSAFFFFFDVGSMHTQRGVQCRARIHDREIKT